MVAFKRGVGSGYDSGGTGAGGGGGGGGGRFRVQFLTRDEFVEDSLVGFESTIRIPSQTAGDKVEESVVFALESLV